MNTETVLVAIGLLLTIVNSLISLSTKLAVAQFAREQAEKCQACEDRFVGRREWNMHLQEKPNG